MKTTPSYVLIARLIPNYISIFSAARAFSLKRSFCWGKCPNWVVQIAAHKFRKEKHTYDHLSYSFMNEAENEWKLRKRQRNLRRNLK